MGFLAFFFLLAAVVMAGAGVILGLIACGVLGVLTTFGIVSSSLWIGFRKQRASAGVRAFLVQWAIVLGLPVGAALAWLAHALFSAFEGEGALLFCGALAGAAAAVAVALAGDAMLRQTARWFSAHCDRVVDALHGHAAARMPIPEPPLYREREEPEIEVVRPETPRQRGRRTSEVGMQWP